MNSQVIENALEEQCKNRWWLFGIFLLTSTPGIFNSIHITSYVFLAEDVKVWCDIPELRSADWSPEQIRNISTSSNEKHVCSMYNWNYTHFKEIGFDSAWKIFTSDVKPDTVKCKQFFYLEKTPKSSIVSEWDLVCDRLPLRSSVQVAVAVGKFFGAFVFGIFGDRFGRKKIFSLGCLLYIFAGPITAFINNYFVFLILRVAVGVAASAVYEAGYTILTELTVKNCRAYVGCLYNISYSVGLLLLPLAAYCTDNWRDLQLLISAPTIILLIHVWLTPESPRWLFIQGKIRKANSVIGHSNLSGAVNSKCDNCSAEKNLVTGHPWYKKLLSFALHFLSLFSSFELTKRILISWFCWFVAQFCYFVLALNGNNFTINQYIYIALNGLFEAPGYFFPIIALTYFGRKTTGIALFGITGVSLIVILFLPKGLPVLTVAMLGRFCISAVFAVIILHTSELFTTSHRNTAIGSSLTMAQLGNIAAPYVVDILGEKLWYLPSTLCGSLALLSAVLIFFLPETRNKTLGDTLPGTNDSET